VTGSVPLAAMRWRTGRKVARTIYAMINDEPHDDDIMIGIMDTAMLAQQVVRDHNQMLGMSPVTGSFG
jgi:hypothetical protein